MPNVPNDTTDIAQAFEPIVRELAPAVARGAAVALVGPPGVGKTMLARRMVGALTLDDHAARWIAAEYEGVFGERPRDVAVPFRAPHHTISEAAMRGSPWGWKHHPACMTMTHPRCACGLDEKSSPRYRTPAGYPIPAYVKTDPGSRGGVWTPGKPGEAELARFGILFLDEIGEFPRRVVEATARRLAEMTVGRPRLIVAANPCACGWSGATVRQCVCLPESRKRWDERLASYFATLGIETRIEVPSMSVRDLQAMGRGARCPSIKTILADASA